MRGWRLSGETQDATLTESGRQQHSDGEGRMPPFLRSTSGPPNSPNPTRTRTQPRTLLAQYQRMRIAELKLD